MSACSAPGLSGLALPGRRLPGFGFPGFGLTLWLLAQSSACASRTPDYPTSLAPNDVERRPPGVSVERTFATPTPETRDPHTAVLVPPVDLVQARHLIDVFLLAVRTEDSRTLDRVLAQGAVHQLSSGREFRSAREYWQRRLARLDYGALGEGPLYRPQELEVRRAGDGETEEASMESSPVRPNHSGEVVLTLRPLMTHVGSTRLFGPELTFLLVEEEGRMVIARILEDFQLL